LTHQGFYNSSTKKVNIVFSDNRPELDRPTLTHELFHRFDLENNISGKVLESFFREKSISQDNKVEILKFILKTVGANDGYAKFYKKKYKLLHISIKFTK